MVTFQFDIPSFSERHSIPGDSSRALFIPDRWRSLNPLKGSLNHPKKVTLNHQVGVFFSNEFRNLSWCNLTCAYVSNGLVKNHHLAFWCCKITISPGPWAPPFEVCDSQGHSRQLWQGAAVKYWVRLSGIMNKKGFLRKIVKIGLVQYLPLFVDVFLLMFWFHVGFKPLVPGTMLRFVDLNFWQPLKPWNHGLM